MNTLKALVLIGLRWLVLLGLVGIAITVAYISIAPDARAAEPACGWFSEKQYNVVDGHVTRYRDTCEHTVCYVLSRSYDTTGISDVSPTSAAVTDNTLSCMREGSK